MLRRVTRSPRLRIICRVVVYARRNPARMNRHIISEFGRIAPKCSLICGKMRGGFPKRRTPYEFAPLSLRGIFARTTRRQPSARSAENPSAAWKPINSPDSGKHPMRKTITAVARDAAIWREHKRRQRSGEQDETRLEGVMPARLDDDKRANDQHGRRARQDEKHRAPAERRTQRATDNRADEQDVILAEQSAKHPRHVLKIAYRREEMLIPEE